MSLPEDGDPIRRIAELEQRLAELERSDRLIAASIGAGGLTVKDGGSITVEGGDIVIKDAAGDTAATLGTVGLALDGSTLEVDDGTVRFDDASDNNRVYVGAFNFGTDTYGMLIYDAAGIAHLIAGDTGAGYGVEIRDADANVLLVTDRTGGWGLSRPYLSLPFVPTDFVNKRSTSSASFDGLFKSYVEVQHRGWRVQVGMTADAGTTGEWRLFDTTDGVQLGSARSIPDGFSGTDSQTATFPASSYGEQHQVELQARVTSGAGQVGIEPQAFYGRQS